MVKLPNRASAVVDIRKLHDYCLSPHHPRGRHKARVFDSVLGLTQDDAENLREMLLSAALSEEATLAGSDEYGERYMLDFVVTTEMGVATVRSGWIVRRGEGFPRLTSCWIA
jgi:hypothetical protein